MLRFFKVARINVDAVTLVPCDETLNLNAAIRHAARAQAPARTALVIADLPAKARTDSAPAFGKRMQSFAVGLPPVLLVQVRHTPHARVTTANSVAMRNAAIHHVVLRSHTSPCRTTRGTAIRGAPRVPRCQCGSSTPRAGSAARGAAAA